MSFIALASGVSRNLPLLNEGKWRSPLSRIIPTPFHVCAGETEQYESTAVFQPVVQLDEVEVKSHEEDEETLYKMYVPR